MSSNSSYSSDRRGSSLYRKGTSIDEGSSIGTSSSSSNRGSSSLDHLTLVVPLTFSLGTLSTHSWRKEVTTRSQKGKAIVVGHLAKGFVLSSIHQVTFYFRVDDDALKYGSQE